MADTARVIHTHGDEQTEGLVLAYAHLVFSQFFLVLSSRNLVPRALFPHLRAQVRERSLGIEVEAPL